MLDGDEDEDRRSPSPPVASFVKKKKNKGRASAGAKIRERASSPSEAVPGQSKQGADDEDDRSQGGDGQVNGIRRTAGIGSPSFRAIGSRGRGGASARPSLSSSSSSSRVGLSFGGGPEGEKGGDEGEAFQLRKSALARASQEARRTSAAGPPESLDQASIGSGAGSAYSPAALADLKAATPGRKGVAMDTDESPGGDDAYTAVSDPMVQVDESGESLARMKFGADFAEEGIPSEALVNAAKEKRRRAAQGKSDENTNGQEDFISLGGSSRGPHPESRLQREDDEWGSGEEEFADFTGATERVALSKRAIEEEKQKRRQEMRERVDELDEEDNSEDEWERAQMSRIDTTGARQKREHREKSPFKPAPIPLTAPLPTLTSTSARLAAQVKELETSAMSHEKVADDAVRGLEQLQHEEAENKVDIEQAGDKEAWFREFEEFILSVAAFLDDKAPRLEALEADWMGLLQERTRMTQRIRARDAEDELSLFFGVPSRSLLPGNSKLSEEEQSDNASEISRLPQEEGDASSPIRISRREKAAARGEKGYDLEASDFAAFAIARQDLERRLKQLFDDVKAAEFLDPAAEITRESDGRKALHPASLAARFMHWRKRYPDDYAGAWGGLALSGVWEFWARKQCCLWDIFRAFSNGQRGAEEEATLGPSSLDRFPWFIELTHYAEANYEGKPAGAIGGDEEVVQSIINNVVIPRALSLVEAGAFDPWDPRDNRGALELVEQLSYLIEKSSAPFQSLVSAFVARFKAHVDCLLQVTASSAPAIPAPGFHPLAPPARVSFCQRIAHLYGNLTRWNRLVGPAERPAFVDLVDQLVGRVLWSFVLETKEVGGVPIIMQILTSTPPNLLRPDVKTRLEGFVTNA
ncbi:hypothetical protein FA10DRAFT_266632 [Acaromyces ingoldii]|uniref:GCFC-domain-containing protein n=1 Tax=Acaromyces ingoldii TaxID=215250 RepID=A0A316YLV0_9BASI|nr:hypothetical protein FA10DRAFT_266632 [Acaromyces ingoldii]PWN90132.1 hypothetical protein FA10DRAFT_266632 [Acaromyces ingoldii]